MKRRILYITWLMVMCLSIADVAAQDMHFSQYYNAPMLLNPANTGLMSEDNYRAGANYRNQWASVPVPYSSFSAYTDYQILRKDQGNKWFGLGLALFNDKAGDGSLSLFRAQGSLAFHLQMTQTSMLSAGMYYGYIQRSVDFDNLTFDAQWDGFTFNKSLANNEKNGVIKTHFNDVGAGVNYALFPNELVYVKVGIGVAHVNQPTENFLGGKKNIVGIRPTGNIDALLSINKKVTFNPSVYLTSQSGALEINYGTLFLMQVAEDDHGVTKLIIGGYNRINDALIGTIGVDLNGLRVMASYDYTISQLAVYNQGNGALEIGIIYQGKYPWREKSQAYMNCPRF